MYLVDTDVLSTGAPGKPDAPVREWMHAHSENLFMSAVSVAEISAGISRLKQTGAQTKAANLDRWLDLLLHLYGERVLPFDASTARLTGELIAQTRAAGYSPGFPDAAIAATAGSRGLTVLTRNLRHFIPFGVDVLDPMDTLPLTPGM